MHPTLGMGWNIGEGVVVIIASLYYRYISLNWAGLIWFTVAVYIFFGIGQIMVLVESPKRLYADKRLLEAYNSLRYMARFNGVTEQPLAELLITEQAAKTDRSIIRDEEIAPEPDQGWKYVSKHYDVLVNWLIMNVQWIACSFCYF